MDRAYRVIIAGGRHFKDYERVKSVCDKLFKDKSFVEIVSGGAPGADFLGERYAKERELNLKRFPAKWGKYKKQAGPIRNSEMANYADALIAFHNGESFGTADMIKKAKAKGLAVRVIEVRYPTK